MKAVNDFWQDQQQGSQLKQLMAEVFQDPDVKKFLADHQDDLTQEAIQRGQSKLYEYVHQKNIIKQGGISVAPGYTPKLVYAAHQIDVSYVPTKEHLAKQAAQELHDRVSTMDMPKNIREANFHDFWLEGKNSSPSRTAAFGKLVSFSQEYDGSHFMPGYYLTGKFGVGKTYRCRQDLSLRGSCQCLSATWDQEYLGPFPDLCRQDEECHQQQYD